jgi:hypothetical protein
MSLPELTLVTLCWGRRHRMVRLRLLILFYLARASMDVSSIAVINR